MTSIWLILYKLCGEILEANVARVVESFRKRGYSVTSPRIIRGLSGFDQQYDLSVANGKGEIVLDVASGPSMVAPEIVVAFFAKILDTKRQRPILVCFAALNHDAQSLVTMYKIETVIDSDINAIVKKLSALFQTRAPS